MRTISKREPGLALVLAGFRLALGIMFLSVWGSNLDKASTIRSPTPI